MRTSQRHSNYIWQHADWPNFRWSADDLLASLTELSGLHGQLCGQMAMLGFGNSSATQLKMLTDELVSTSEIEGVSLNAASVRSSIARKLGIEDDGAMVEDHYVEGLVGVMLDAIKNHKSPINKERLFDWHCALFPTGRSGMYKITVGNWRQGAEPMRVVSGAFGHEKVHFTAPPSDAIDGEMQRLIDWCNSAEVSPYIKAAIAHLWFVTIHPFDDGNGRISRTLADMYLAELDNGARYYSMSAQLNRNKKAYYDILERTQKGNLDITAWLLWFFNCLKDAILHTMQTVKRTLDKTAFWDAHCNIEINERQRKIINRLWDGFDGKLTTSKWAKMCSCSQDTALRDINDLIAKNILCDTGSKGRNKNYILNEII